MCRYGITDAVFCLPRILSLAGPLTSLRALLGSLFSSSVPLWARAHPHLLWQLTDQEMGWGFSPCSQWVVSCWRRQECEGWALAQRRKCWRRRTPVGDEDWRVGQPAWGLGAGKTQHLWWQSTAPVVLHWQGHLKHFIVLWPTSNDYSCWIPVIWH